MDASTCIARAILQALTTGDDHPQICSSLITLEHPLKLDGNVCEQEFQNYA